MRKNILFAFLLLMVAGVQTAWSQAGVVIWKDGHHEVVNIEQMDSMMFSEDVKCYIPSDYVDLGLPSGTLWATCNIGAESPEESGEYFAWGETEVKEVYNWETYKFCNGTHNSMTKYCTNETYGQVDDLEVLSPEDDAATVLWGSDWEMPTEDQFRELINNEYTSKEKTRKNGVEGIKITSKANGASIFLPSASLSSGKEGGYYYSRTVYLQLPNLASALGFNASGYTTMAASRRCDGLTIRPVHKKVFTPTYVDLGLPSGTLWATCNVGAESPEEYGDYFAWGELQPKERYWWDTYSLCNGKSDSMNKYCTKSEYGTVDGKLVLRTEDDAATFNWGSDWQIPTAEQFNELVNSDNTTKTQTTVNGVFGLKITSKRNGKSIFLPAAGEMSVSNPLQAGKYGRYWARAAWPNYPNEARYLFFGDGDIRGSFHERCYGLSVRPVRVQDVSTEPEYVNLGLPSGTLWATHNIGAACAEEYGDYFAWGETQPKQSYSWDNYLLSNGSDTTLKRYNFSEELGRVDGKIMLRGEDDAATVNWGSEWQMPSLEQVKELYNSDYVDMEWTDQNGVKGMKITSKINGNSIFLPAAGEKYSGGYVAAGTHLYYWSRTLDTYLAVNCNSTAMGLYYSPSDGIHSGSGHRCVGQSVRPVRKQAFVPEHVDLGLPSHTLWATCNVGAEYPEEYGEHFAWGETLTKEEYTKENYIHWNNSYDEITKYCNDSESGTVDNLVELLPEDDAASVNWNSGWQMPSVQQVDELLNSEYTTTQWTTLHGIYGRKITSKANGNSIFLPAAGILIDANSSKQFGIAGRYWSRSLYEKRMPGNAYILNFSENEIKRSQATRSAGRTVRPVRIIIN